MKYRRSNNNFIQLPNMAWLALVLITFSLVTAIGLRAIPWSWAAQNTMMVYQQKDGKIFGNATTLEIFDNPKLGGQKLVAPFTKGSYEFAVHNSADNERLPYSLSIAADNPENIPLVFNVTKNGKYIFGGESLSDMRLLTELKFPELLLEARRSDIYMLQWEWKTESDELDTAIGNNGTQRYNLTITAIGTVEEVKTGGGGITVVNTPKPRPTPPTKPGATPDPITPIDPNDPGVSTDPMAPIEVVDIINPEESADSSISTDSTGHGTVIGLAKPDIPRDSSGIDTAGRPKTDDESNMTLWIAIMSVSIVLLFVLIFFTRRKKEDETYKDLTKDR